MLALRSLDSFANAAASFERSAVACFTVAHKFVEETLLLLTLSSHFLLHGLQH